jgi:uncharacterized membrane protein YdjX (TVP38/TMEM64 family)
MMMAMGPSLFIIRLIAIINIAAPAVSFVPSNTMSIVYPGVSIYCNRGRPTTFLQIDGDNKQQYKQKYSIRSKKKKVGKKRIKLEGFILGTTILLLGMMYNPSSCSAASIIPSKNDIQSSLVSILDGLAHSGTKGMLVYTLSFILWTMIIGATTPIETAAGMAFPLRTAIILSAIGKITGAFSLYILGKYLFRDYALEKMKNNKWIKKINASFGQHPLRVALIWRFSPLPEFVKDIGPSLVPALRTRYQILAIITHGLPFTCLWSMMGNEAAIVARGGQASVLLKRMVAIITWIGLVVSPTLFGMWIKGLGNEKTTDDESEKVYGVTYPTDSESDNSSGLGI